MRKLFILAAAVLSLLPLRLSACGAEEYPWDGVATFRIVTPYADDDTSYRNATLKETVAFWHKYLGGRVAKTDIESFFNDATLESYTTGEHARHPFAVAVKANSYTDKYMKACLTLQQYVEQTWEYEAPGEDFAHQALAIVRTMGPAPAAFQYRATLLSMRINAALHRYDQNIVLWTTTASKCPDAALKQRMQGYLAGAYYHQNKFSQALPIFYSVGDQMSIKWCLSHLCGYRGLSNLSASQNPNDRIATLHILQDYVNYFWYACHSDSEIYRMGNVDFSDVRRDGHNVLNLCFSMIEKGGADKVAWQSAAAYMKMAEGDFDTGLRLALEAQKAGGDAEQRENCNRLVMLGRLLLAQSNAQALETGELVADYEKLLDKAEKELRAEKKRVGNDDIPSYEHCLNYCFLMRTYQPHLLAYLTANNMHQGRLVVLNNADYLTETTLDYGADTWGCDYFTTMDREMSTDDVIAFYQTLKTKNATDMLAQMMLKTVKGDEQVLIDLIGTKLMRDGKYGQAISYFEQLKPEFIKKMNVSPYLAVRKFDEKAPFWRTQRKEPDWEAEGTSRNVKLEFCRDMAQRIAQLATLKGEKKAKMELSMAARMFQGSSVGDLWMVSEYGWSYYDQQPNMLCAQARIQLNHALEDVESDELRSQIYFGLASVPAPGEPFYTMTWDWDKETYNYTFNMFSPQRDAYEWLTFHRSPIDYVSKCDVLRAYARMR